jgi:hypothetical protein
MTTNLDRTITRRKLLGGAGGASAGLLSGCGVRNVGRRGTQSAGERIEQTGGPDHDHAGDWLGESDPVKRLSVSRIDGSRRMGSVVYFDPDNPGPYADGEDALADVPVNGTFYLDGIYSLPEEGPIVVDRPMHLRGAGWSRVDQSVEADVTANRNGESIHTGSVILNAGEDALDRPNVACESVPGENARENVSIANLAIQGSTPNNPIVEIRDSIGTSIVNCDVNGGYEPRAPIGIHYVGRSDRATLLRNRVQSVYHRGIKISAVGFAHHLFYNNVNTWPRLDERYEEDGGVAIETAANRTIVVGGIVNSYVREGEHDRGAAIWFNPGNRSDQHGGLVIEPGTENAATAVRVGNEDNPFHDVQVYHHKVGYRKYEGNRPAVQRTIDFRNAVNCKLINPIVWDRTGDRFTGELARWGPDAEHCGVHTDVTTLRKVTYTNEGATQPYIDIQGSATDDELVEVPTGVPMQLDYATDHGTPAVHDGDRWYRLAREELSVETT